MPTRFPENPIIRPEMLPGLEGGNINGPSLIRAPDWLERPLGRYYLYFAHHRGRYIRLAVADRLQGPWRVYEPGTLRLEETRSKRHIASPDVHVDDATREIRMYFHGRLKGVRMQSTFLAVSRDGLHFTASPEDLGPPYFRVFDWRGDRYALATRGQILRQAGGAGPFERGPGVGEERLRHAAVSLEGDELHVFYSRIGDEPERILASRIELGPDWHAWKLSAPREVLEPEMDYEGAGLALEPSQRGIAEVPVRQLRDPAIFRENGRRFLLYSVAGEAGIAIAALDG